MKNLTLMASCLAAAAAAADDVVGWMRVCVPSNDVAAAVLPYEPMGGGSPGSFVSGPFVGDGGEGSDVLIVYASDGSATNGFAWAGTGWLGLSGETNSAAASAGDVVALLPYGSLPFDFFLFGRFGPAAPAGGFPRFSGMSVDPAGGFADLAVSTGGRAADLLVRDADDPVAEPAAWSHAWRFAGEGAPVAWRDAALPGPATNRLYMVSDAVRDADRDGIPDAVERCVHGTSPLLADTDGDGVRDGLEVAWGMDPLVADLGAGWRFFEPFELPEVGLGELNGQHGWRVGAPSAAIVQSRAARSGRASLRLLAEDAEDGGAPVLIERPAADAGGVVWVDAYYVAEASDASVADAAAAGSCGLFFSRDAHPVAVDGGALRTNAGVVVSLGEWTRVTFRLDYPARRWDLYVDGMAAGEGLRMGAGAAAFSAIGGSGDGEILLDDVSVSGTRPMGLSSDGDPMPDEWEFRHFGSLSRDGSGDADGDGLSDLEEFRHRTDPLSADTDGDGLPDAAEVDFYGTSPLACDTDGDGVPDAQEIAAGADPLVAGQDGGVEFVESFEMPGVAPGGLDGQNGWSVGGPGSAVVQGGVVRTGAAALNVSSDDDGGEVVVSRPATNGWSAVWVDAYCVARAAAPPPGTDGDGVFFDAAGRPVVCFCGTFATNMRTRVALGGWVRTTMRMDYAARTWDAYVAGVAVGTRLPMSPSTGASFGGIGCVGEGETTIDDIRVSRTRPQGLSADGDALPDEWELANFGGLDRTGLGDADRDGLRDVDEFKAGTDPNSADTDGDGLPDRWEVGCGTDPNDPADASADPDGDGIDNAAEYALGLDPLRPDADPRIPPEIDLRTDRPWYLAGQTVHVEAFAADSDGAVRELTVYRDGHEIVHAFGGHVTVSYTAVAGTNVVEAVAADDSGKSALARLEVPVFAADDDSDGDGLSNAEEQALGTDPASPDADGDGMPDLWESLHGTDPVVADASADPDGDGLDNLGEFLSGTDPHLADTDGDGMSDGEECTALFSDPLAADFDGSVTTNAVIPASAVDAAHGSWYVVEGVLVLGERAGTAYFTNDLAVAAAGVRQLRADVLFSGPFDAELVCRVDGKAVGAVLLRSSSAARAESVRFTTFWLAEGIHLLEFELQNFGNGAAFSMGDVAVCTPQGPDADGNGVADWLDSRLSRSRALRGASAESFVSPFCLRGTAGRPDMVQVSGGTPVCALPHFGWCADVPLDPATDTAVEVSYENGMKGEVVSVRWRPFDAMDRSDVVLRRGDSLLFAADGTSVALDGDMLTDGLDGPCAHCFGEAGDFSLVACSGARTNVVSVHVVSVEAAEAMPVWRGKVNSLPFAPSGPDLVAVRADRGAAVDSVAADGSARMCSLSVWAHGRPSSLSFEIPNPDASVVRAVRLQPFSANYTVEGRYYVVATTDDGSCVVENRISAFDLPPSAVLRMTSGSGITFPDGSGSLEMTGLDFDEIGDLSYQFLIPAGVDHPCQFLRLMFDGKAVAR